MLYKYDYKIFTAYLKKNLIKLFFYHKSSSFYLLLFLFLFFLFFLGILGLGSKSASTGNLPSENNNIIKLKIFKQI